VSGAGQVLLDSIEAGLDADRGASELAAEILQPGIVGLLADGADTGAWGAVTVARALPSQHLGSALARPPDVARQGLAAIGNSTERLKEVVARDAMT
jgi:hypothetical protein